MKFEGMSRSVLAERIVSLIAELKASRRSEATMLDNLTATQTRCTELNLELRAYRASGLNLPGWWCPCEATDKSLGIYNGGGKETRTECRVCGRPKPA